MLIRKFDFGAEYARNLSLLSEHKKLEFVHSFVLPQGFDLEDFYNGSKYFVYGAKGSGKTALLQYIKIRSEAELGANTRFYYFQSTFSASELGHFREAIAKRPKEEIINDTVFQIGEDSAMFWRLFILDEVRRLLRRADVHGTAADTFFKAIEAAKLIGQSEQNRKKYPSLEKFSLKLSQDPSIELEGSFEAAQPKDLVTYLEVAEEALEDVYLEQSPIFLFVDEMEVYRKGAGGDDIQIAAIAALVRCIRDFSERFASSDIRVIAAIRQEVVDEVSKVQYEIHRIVRDKGLEIDWPMPVKTGYHPLERTILNRIATQDDTISNDRGITDRHLDAVKEKYFRPYYPAKKILDATWYRPRDMALLFEIAQKADGNKDHFDPHTLTVGCLPALGKRLWQDAKSGLSSKYPPDAIRGIDRLLRGGQHRYNRSEWLTRLAILRDQDEWVARLSDHDWEGLLESLYRVGVVYYVATRTGYKNFFFRGDAMPTFNSSFDIGIHDSLRNELALT